MAKKPEQLRMMGRIFNQAELVIAWLGVSDYSNAALHVLGLYGQKRPSASTLGRDHFSGQSYEPSPISFECRER